MSFLRNAWYVAGWADEFSQQPFRRKILGEDMVLYRTGSGAPVAVSNRCPHRFAPLHLGRVDGESLACRYHGLAFDK
ncbi:MAG TPA: Rieske 2Fe-2S domain-containing protein, partial [Steroidobacteraceae bacterium]|nr:Rieske 2Fe-2S domain-containing protein [Steroidobacteraceae bacterium]